MLNKVRALAKKRAHQTLRLFLSWLPRHQRYRIFRWFVDCNPTPSERLVLKLAETKEELEACFSVLHDAYVDSGFMKPDPCGMRVTIYHALPTTSILCAKYDGEVVGTISLIRESTLGVPLQEIFDLASVRAKEGQMAEVSALAIRRDFRNTGGSILFPLMKFMYEYCTTFFDTRHLVIAVNPRHIEMYESLLFFERLTEKVVDRYDFVNGAPAIGATLDLQEALGLFKAHYSSKPIRRNLYAYFTQVKLDAIKFPHRRFFTTNDPVLTPELLNHFFNARTRTFTNLNERKKALLHLIYDLPEYEKILPHLSVSTDEMSVRRHERFTVVCPAKIAFSDSQGQKTEIAIEVVEVSLYGFHARTTSHLPLNVWCDTTIQLGHDDISYNQSVALHEEEGDRNLSYYGFRVEKPDLIWRNLVSALYQSTTAGDLNTMTYVIQ